MLLQKRTGRSGDAGPLAEKLGCLPLALEQAAAYILVHKISFDAYLKSYKRRGLKLLEMGEPSTMYPASVATTWSLSIESVREQAPASAELLNAAAFLAPDSIPIEIFTLGGAELDGELADALKGADEDPLIFWELIGALERYSLVERLPDNTFTLHRLTQEVIKGSLDMGKQVWAGRVVRALNATYPAVEFENWPLCERVQPNAPPASDLIREFEMEFTDATLLLSKVGHFAWTRGEHNTALKLHDQTLEIRDRVLGPEHPDTLTSMGNLADTLRALGDLSGARKLEEQTLRIRERVLGPEHPDTLTSMNNLAETLSALGDFARAKRLQEQTLDLRKHVLGPEHSDTLTSMGNLADTLRALGDHDAARKLQEQTLYIQRRVLGPEHPSTLASMNNLASTLRDLGDLSEARKFEEQTLDIQERVLGPEHPSTLASMNNLAGILREMNEAEEAKVLFGHVLDKREAVLGSEHPDTTRPAWWLLTIAQEENDPDTSAQMLEKLRWLAECDEESITSASQRNARRYVLEVMAKAT